MTLEEETNMDLSSEELKGSEDSVLASTQTHVVSESEDTLESSGHYQHKYSCRRGREAARAINNAAKIHRLQDTLPQLAAQAGEVLSISPASHSNQRGIYCHFPTDRNSCEPSCKGSFCAAFWPFIAPVPG